MALFSESPWKWTSRFQLLSGASLLVGFVSALLHPLFGDSSALGGVLFFIAILCSWALVAGVVGTVVSFVRERRGHHAPPAKPVA